jgi:hypothetical protein
VGATHTIQIPTETRFFQKGKPAGRANQFNLKLDPKTRPATQLKP